MKFTRTQNRRFAIEKVRLPLVALIDVILFLLIYFIMAGSLAAEESELRAALQTEKKQAGQGSDLAPQVLFVEAPGGAVRFRIGERVFNDRPSLTAVLKQLPKDQGIRVRVSGEPPVESAAAALQACTEAGFSKVSYVPGR
ncbi:MAG: biopolymer transporter ExbD [Phycisphaerales bacterium]